MRLSLKIKERRVTENLGTIEELLVSENTEEGVLDERARPDGPQRERGTYFNSPCGLKSSVLSRGPANLFRL
jgi:hypothetical protein